MLDLIAQLRLLSADRRGIAAMEYGLIAAFVAVAIIGATSLLGGNLSNLFSGIATTLGGVTVPNPGSGSGS